MFKNSEIKKMIAPWKTDSKNELKLKDYLIQGAGSDNFLIHREISLEEQRNYKNDEIFEYEGKKYLACIANCPSVEQAELAVLSYWNATRQLSAL